MKITDKMRLDWILLRRAEVISDYEECSVFLPGEYEPITGRSVRRAIDAAIRSEKGRKKN